MKQLKSAFILKLVLLAASANAQVGIGTTAPAASAQLDVNSTSKGLLPPRMTTAQRNAIISPEEGLMIYNTTTKKPNYYDGIEWKNFDGTFNYSVGDAYQGGIIAYILQPGDPGYNANVPHGLIAAASDQSAAAEWGCNGTLINGADGVALGTGNQNTIDILAGCATPSIAAKLCADLVLNGYTDWYLPSKDELNKLYINQTAIGGFQSLPGIYYLSSSESSSTHAWAQTFLGGFQGQFTAKNSTRSVRALRSF